MLLAFTGILLGLAILLCAVVIEGIATRLPLQIVVGLAGFALMLGSAYITVTSLRPGLMTEAPPAESDQRRPEPGKQSTPDEPNGSFMNRFEQRWHRRRDGEH